MTNSNILDSEIELINKFVFTHCGIALTAVNAESESKKYFAHNFKLGGQKVQFRKSKITPTKIGQFVSIWKRNEKGITESFDILDDFDFFMIAARKETNFGVFIFPKTVLYEKGIVSDQTRDGKRGIRVYPTWDMATNKQAQKTQLWQTEYFLEISQDNLINLEKAKKLLNFNKEI